MHLAPAVLALIVLGGIVVGCVLSALVWPERPLANPLREKYDSARGPRGTPIDAVDEPEFRRPTNEGKLL
jgi:hypothetical protein